jgi:hypothetical protein
VFRFSVAMKLRVAMRLDERMYFPEVSHRKHVARVVENAQPRRATCAQGDNRSGVSETVNDLPI